MTTSSSRRTPGPITPDVNRCRRHLLQCPNDRIRCMGPAFAGTTHASKTWMAGTSPAMTQEALSFRACRPQIKRHDFTITRHQDFPGNPDPRAVDRYRRRRADRGFLGNLDVG